MIFNVVSCSYQSESGVLATFVARRENLPNYTRNFMLIVMYIVMYNFVDARFWNLVSRFVFSCHLGELPWQLQVHNQHTHSEANFDLRWPCHLLLVVMFYPHCSQSSPKDDRLFDGQSHLYCRTSIFPLSRSHFGRKGEHGGNKFASQELRLKI